MKNRILILILLVAQAVNYAQESPEHTVENKKSNYSVSLQIGPNFSKFKSNKDTENAFKTGLLTGVSFEPMLSSKSGLDLGVYYTTLGAKFKNENLELEEISVSYIHLPFLLKIYWVKSFSIGFGTYMAFNVGHSYTINPNIQTFDAIKVSNPRFFEMGFESKVQFYFTEKLFSNLYFFQAFTKLIDEKEDLFNDMYNTSMGISLGYRLK